MVSRLEMIREVDEEIMSSAKSLLARLPILPVKTVIINNGKRDSFYEKNTLLRKLKLYKCRRGTKSEKVRDLMIEYLKGVE